MGSVCVGAASCAAAATGVVVMLSTRLLAPEARAPASALVGTPVVAKVDEVVPDSCGAAEGACEETITAVERVVARLEAATEEMAGAAPMAPKEPAPQRHWQLQEPSEAIVPVPWAIAPGEPTAGAAAAEIC